MPEKRKRRVASPARGLAAGEKLNRTRLLQEADIRWSWVGTEVTREEDITREHCLRAAGLLMNSGKPCPNKYAAKSKEPSPVQRASSSSSTPTEPGGDVIVISDEEDESCCDKKRCKDNPLCLNYLGQEKWENEDRALRDYLKVNLNEEYPYDLSKKPNIPVGLKNLGATCYANAFLQVWFQDLAFRSAVYKCEPSDSMTKQKFEESPIFQLQCTFAALQESNKAVFDPVKLVESLQLQTSIQQDAQEFSKLFMSHLDNEFKKQSDPKLQSLLPDQFEGKVVHATVCDQCKSRSERESSFLELEVNLENNATLDERIRALLEPERMVGDNQYRCSVCDSLQDASRYTELRQLPPVLHVSLLRFVYDTTSWERKKSKDKIRFPPCLNMRQFVGSHSGEKPMEIDLTKEDDDDYQYELRGVLLHKGQSAYCGHYEAQVYDCTAKKWYQFNDETVSHLDSFTTSAKVADDESNEIVVDDAEEAAGSAKSKTVKRPKKAAKARRVLDSDDEQEEKVEASNIRSRNFIHSKDAYMLVYARRGQSVGLDEEAKSLLRPPARAMQIVKWANDDFRNQCTFYESKQRETEESFHKKRQMVMDVYKSWSISNLRESYRIASRASLEKWLSNGLDPPKTKDSGEEAQPNGHAQSSEEQAQSSNKTSSSDDEFPEFLTIVTQPYTNGKIDSSNVIDNCNLLCHHRKLSAPRTKGAKLISMRGYELMKDSGFCFEPDLSPDAICEVCVRSEFREKLYQIEHPRIVAEFNEVCNPELPDTGFWISKVWLKDWSLQKPKMHRPSEDDPAPDSPDYAANVVCEHGGLNISLTNRRRITPEGVEILQKLFPDYLPVPIDKPDCSVCDMHANVSEVARREQREAAENEKALLSRLHKDNKDTLYGRSSLVSGRAGVIIPSDFIRAWRSWIIRPADAQRPVSVDNSFLLCKHAKLLHDFNDASDFGDDLAVITRDEWDMLTRFYEAGPLITVQSIISCEANDDVLVSEPACCEECRLSSKLDFVETRLTVVHLRMDDIAPSSEDNRVSKSGVQSSTKLPEFLRNGKSGSLASGERTLPSYGRANGTRQSRRIRDNLNSSRIRHIHVNKSSTVMQIRQSIEKEFNIAPYLQRLYYRGTELKEDNDTVASLLIQAGDTLHMKEIEDLGSEADKPAAKKTKRNEGGAFEGTLLGGSTRKDEAEPVIEQQKPHADTTAPASYAVPATSKSCSACTFDNPATNFQCEMCSTPLPLVC